MKLENFRSWRELDIELAPVTVLFGANNSGKSNILSALLLLKQSQPHPEPINLGGDRQDYVDFGSYSDLVHQRDPLEKVTVSISWDSIEVTDNDSADHLDFGVRWGLRATEVIVEKIQYADNQSHLDISLRDGSYTSGTRSNPDKNIVRLDKFYKFDYPDFSMHPTSTLYAFKDWYILNFEKLMESISYLGP
ncbi:MAG: AAA family ATPase, partial [Chloroflexota bacterium]